MTATATRDLRIGIDVGGTFTDFLVTRGDDEPRVFKVLSTPADPAVGLIDGLQEIARSLGLDLGELAGRIEKIVHGTTVTTNAILTRNGARTALLTTDGVRDALAMRRGIREEQYNNRYTNVPPLVPRHRRFPVRGRLDHAGGERTPLVLDDVRAAIAACKVEGATAVAICFMNSFADPEHERRAAALVRAELPDAYLTVSAELLPSIRFYDRLSTTVLNSYVGPRLSAYLDSLRARLAAIGFAGVLLIMQSNGGVMAPDVARRQAVRTLLSGPAAGPGAGLAYARNLGQASCITVDMGGTSFDAALVRDGAPVVVTEGEIDRHRIALPMLGIATIGAGGGSIGWIDEGGLLRMGPQSAGADPGPACYGRGGTLPTCTDADLLLGYLDPDFFAGGRLKLDRDAAAAAITAHIARPLGLAPLAAAAGMYRVINTNMAQGVREITIKRGYDPREFPLVVAGGAGPLHACMICQELGIPMFIVPRESSIFCAAGMLMSDLEHDFVRSFVSPLDRLDWRELGAAVDEMIAEGARLLAAEQIPESRRKFLPALDCRYVNQYHEVPFPVARAAIAAADLAPVAAAFHAEHNRLYGYSLEEEGTAIELINVRLRAVGVTDKPRAAAQAYAGPDPAAARKGERRIHVIEEGAERAVPVYDGHRTRHGHRIAGPAIVEQVNTTLYLGAAFDLVCDRSGSFAVYLRGREELVATALAGGDVAAAPGGREVRT